jgi:hypothetical protein
MHFVLSGILLLSLAAHAIVKGAALLPEMLWACHVASFIMVIGVASQQPRLTAIGLLFHAAVGLPSYLTDVVATHTTTPTSLMVHVVPIIVGVMALRSAGYPRGILLLAWALYPLMVFVSYLFTAPALNINLSHATWPPVATLLPHLWMQWAVNVVMALACMLAADTILRRWLGSKES